ncbi:site-specific integrase [Streptosporangium amethystogenes]|uniref:site-specific integrase n=1 Tax=Streptosporangium amethystogenes TaxID=2002 RepID=UPI00247FC8FA|nr:site-specific integrase [Streptosporangium amethystogenes]
MRATPYDAPARTTDTTAGTDKHPTLAAYLTRWLAEVIEPNREPTTYAGYEALARLYMIPGLGKKQLDKLTVREVQTWLNTLVMLCTCCDQKKDHQRPQARRRCCSKGECCREYPSRSTIASIRRILRSALSNAIRDELISKNVAAPTILPNAGKTKKAKNHGVWNVDEARKFLEHLRSVDEPLYTAYVLILILGLRRGEVLGLAWDCVDLDGEQLWISRRLNRVRGELLHRETTKTEDSTASLPLFGLCTAALRDRQRIQEKARQDAGEKWKHSDLVFTTKNGTPIEPRNFYRSFERYCERAGAPASTTPGTPAPHSWPRSTFTLASRCAPPALANLGDHERLHAGPLPGDSQGARPAQPAP